jgi:hypothetical protein
MVDLAYKRADFSRLRETKYGIGFHWTTWTAPKTGEPKPFEAAVEAFDVHAFVRQAVEAGAGHVLFTTTHALHWLPGPNPYVDGLIRGRTCQRDLIMEIADGLLKEGILLILYYNFGVYAGDADWREACGLLREDNARFFRNCCRILSWMGERYGEKVAAFWFDVGLEAFPDAPFAEITAAAKAGNPDRLVCYNPAVEKTDLVTPYQDYWAGEICRLNYLPRGPLTPTGLPWYTFTTWHPDMRYPAAGTWGMEMETRDQDWPAPCTCSVAAYLERFLTHDGAVTFNLLCYQDGAAYEPDLKVMREIKRLFR